MMMRATPLGPVSQKTQIRCTALRSAKCFAMSGGSRRAHLYIAAKRNAAAVSHVSEAINTAPHAVAVREDSTAARRASTWIFMCILKEAGDLCVCGRCVCGCCGITKKVKQGFAGGGVVGCCRVCVTCLARLQPLFDELVFSRCQQIDGYSETILVWHVECGEDSCLQTQCYMRIRVGSTGADRHFQNGKGR